MKKKKPTPEDYGQESQEDFADRMINLGYNKALEEVEEMIDKEVSFCKGSNIIIHSIRKGLQELKSKEEKC
jgi:hypothetical protein